eukprot:CAMPEP_0113953538 /NCGR_PEP_ID=MMETSP1339-20121228/91028_1 /TAXON_ID=94617 /ORGANISM="Fibrocapsa japonica" /LENGTH=111 /DNA_ID=CAMNT_0000962273 /DNA_START=458 /DNA_END=793 /DNA_ORIENTATION=- /assembly_acc=CAM_ASM_000762
MSFVHGDATKLDHVFSDKIKSKELFNAVVDKGLIDALLCDEGWCYYVEKTLKGIAEILADGGVFLLIGFKLPDSTKDFLRGSTQNELDWQFDHPFKSTEAVSYSMARRIKR